MNNRRNRRWVALALMTAVLTTASACGKAVDSDELRVGVQFGLTGVNASFDSVYDNAAKIAFAEAEENGINGKPVTFHYADDASDPATAVSVARKFVSQDQVQAMYGPGFTPTSLSTMEVASSSKVPFYTPGSINPKLTEPLNEYVFSSNFSSNDVADGIAKLADSMGAKRIGMLAENDAYGDAAVEGAEASLAEYGLKIDATQKISANATDATTQMRELQAANVDLVLLGVTAPAIAAALNAQIDQQIYLPMATFAGSNESLDTLASSDPRIQYYALTPLACPVGDDCTADFLTAWEAAYPDQEPIVWSVQAYASAKAFLAGLANAEDFTPDGIVAGLQTMEPYETPELPCPIQFSPDSHKGTSCTNFYEITGGEVAFFGNDVRRNELTK